MSESVLTNNNIPHVLFFTGEICAFKIHGQEMPFEAVVLNKTSGEGRLRAKSPIDCELQKEYTFIIQAYDCGAGPSGTNWKKSHKAVVHIQVKDVNEFAPTFKETSYKTTVTEGKIYDSILQVEAVDEDCSPQYSQICNYEIATPDVPFAIDRNDWNKRIEYKPGSGSIPLFPSIHLETCDGPVSSIQTTIELQTNYIGKGCDRETYSEKSLQKLCGASSGAIDLLPTPSAATNWTAGLLIDNNDMIFKFDGKQGAKIPDGIVPKNLTDQFTITMWMKHGPSPGLRAEKETILCNSDKTEMNRHHYALYVHNCRLVFLLRKDFDQADTFRPAEFHWKLDQHRLQILPEPNQTETLGKLFKDNSNGMDINIRVILLQGTIFKSNQCWFNFGPIEVSGKTPMEIKWETMEEKHSMDQLLQTLQIALWKSMGVPYMENVHKQTLYVGTCIYCSKLDLPHQVALFFSEVFM
ncbi:Calsyntenin-2 [Chelonia mydas]|uniref:Calsyntenin-2 n=1 Tax=Chelonia mydas TaxID=8469 RepID=M7BMV0_CHEMY|nr:Calsyntenin-2 [Chelonia mydas]